jgi:hypothetical protein
MKYLLIDTNMYLKGKRLKKLLEAIDEQKVPDINVGKSTSQRGEGQRDRFLVPLSPRSSQIH